MLWFLPLACKNATPIVDPPFPTDVPPPTATDPPEQTADTAAPVPEVDCSQLPEALGGDLLVSPRAYHGIAFDQTGRFASGDNTNLLLSTSTTDTTLFVANIGTLQQMAYLPNGDLIVARDQGGSIERITPDGQREVLASGIGAYGVEIGPDGMIYTANQTRIDRIDPTGALAPTVWLPTTVINTPKVLTFNREGTSVYVGTNFRNGNVWRVDVDTDGNAITPPVSMGRTPGSWHDGILLDACGNLYVNEYNTSTLYRRIHGGTVWAAFVRFNNLGGFPGDLYGHGMAWGSGVGHWPATSVYLPLPYNGNRVGTFDLGVPGRDYNDGVYTVVR